MTEEEKSLEVETPMGKLRARGYDLVSILLAVGLGAGIYMQMQHAKAAEESAAAASVNAKETAQAIREMTCVILLIEAKKFDQIASADAYCKRVAR